MNAIERAKKLTKMSARDRSVVSAVIDALQREPVSQPTKEMSIQKAEDGRMIIFEQEGWRLMGAIESINPFIFRLEIMEADGEILRSALLEDGRVGANEKSVNG